MKTEKELKRLHEGIEILERIDYWTSQQNDSDHDVKFNCYTEWAIKEYERVSVIRKRLISILEASYWKRFRYVIKHGDMAMLLN